MQMSSMVESLSRRNRYLLKELEEAQRTNEEQYAQLIKANSERVGVLPHGRALCICLCLISTVPPALKQGLLAIRPAGKKSHVVSTFLQCSTLAAH